MSAYAGVTLKKQQQQQSNKQHSLKLTVNVVTEITVPGFPLQRSSTRFPNFEKKNRKSLKLTLTHQMEHKKLVTGISISIISVFENTTDENNDMAPFT